MKLQEYSLSWRVLGNHLLIYYLKIATCPLAFSKSSFNLTYGVLLSCAMWQSMATMREAHVLVAIMPSKDINASGCKVATLGEQLLS